MTFGIFHSKLLFSGRATEKRTTELSHKHIYDPNSRHFVTGLSSYLLHRLLSPTSTRRKLVGVSCQLTRVRICNHIPYWEDLFPCSAHSGSLILDPSHSTVHHPTSSRLPKPCPLLRMAFSKPNEKPLTSVLKTQHHNLSPVCDSVTAVR